MFGNFFKKLNFILCNFGKLPILYKTLPVILKYKAPRPSTINKTRTTKVIWDPWEGAFFSSTEVGDIY